MEIGGLQKTTLIDYPGKVACTVFVSGCNFRCPFCYSPELVLPEKIKEHPKISEEELFSFLKERKGLLEGVVLCGGEPTFSPSLPELVRKIKDMGFLIKLDTNGSSPKMLRKLIKEGLVDYVAMDIKAPVGKYKDVIGVDINTDLIKESVDILKEGTVDYEFRTTLVPGIHSKEDILKIAEWLKGAKRYCLQNFRAEKTIDPKFESLRSFEDSFLNELKENISSYFDECLLR